jgi:glycosyltransferase involved in cell wall biosynthesis
MIQKSHSGMTVGIIIPAYQAERSVGDVVRSCIDEANVAGVIVVDDGSTDATGNEALAAGAEVIVHEVNRGKGAALVTAFEAASRYGWDAAITIDADGQHSPHHIASFIDRFAETRPDVIVGTRQRTHTAMPIRRRISNSTSSAVVSKLAGTRITDSQSGYRLMSRRTWEQLEFVYTRFGMESELLVKASRAGFRIEEIPIETVYGDEQSHFRPLRDTFRIVRVFLGLWRDIDGRS